MVKKIENCLEILLDYFVRKHKKSKLYRGILKMYGLTSMVVIMLAVSAIDNHTVGSILWIVGTAVAFFVVNIAVLTFDVLGLVVYELLKPYYAPKKRTQQARLKSEERTVPNNVIQLQHYR